MIYQFLRNASVASPRHERGCDKCSPQPVSDEHQSVFFCQALQPCRFWYPGGVVCTCPCSSFLGKILSTMVNSVALTAWPCVGAVVSSGLSSLGKQACRSSSWLPSFAVPCLRAGLVLILRTTSVGIDVPSFDCTVDLPVQPPGGLSLHALVLTAIIRLQGW